LRVKCPKCLELVQEWNIQEHCETCSGLERIKYLLEAIEYGDTELYWKDREAWLRKHEKVEAKQSERKPNMSVQLT